MEIHLIKWQGIIYPYCMQVIWSLKLFNSGIQDLTHSCVCVCVCDMITGILFRWAVLRTVSPKAFATYGPIIKEYAAQYMKTQEQILIPLGNGSPVSWARTQSITNSYPT